MGHFNQTENQVMFDMKTVVDAAKAELAKERADKAKQEPARQEYFRDKLKQNREGMCVEGIPKMKRHAQILSVA